MSLRFGQHPGVKHARLSYAALALAAMAATPLAQAAQWPVTPEQRTTAEQVANLGVPLSEIAPNAPEAYTVKSGDTLWAISKMYLKSPWRWPELWGMNLAEIRNPHLIYPGQLLVLDADGREALGVELVGLAVATERPHAHARMAFDLLVDLSLIHI